MEMASVQDDSSLKRKRETEAPAIHSTSHSKRRNRYKKRKLGDTESSKDSSNQTSQVNEPADGQRKRRRKHRHKNRHSRAGSEVNESRTSVTEKGLVNGHASQNPTDPQPPKRKRNRRKDPYRKKPYGASNGELVAASRVDSAAAGMALARATWHLSTPFGGRLIDKKPIFSTDEKYLILATDYHVQVYTNSNSSLSHSFAPNNDNGTITAMTLAASDPQYLYTSTSSGLITKWSWQKSKEVAKQATKVEVREIVSVKLKDHTQDTVFTVQKEKRWAVVARQVEADHKASKTVLQLDKPIRQLQLSADGSIAAAITMNSIIIGTNASKGSDHIHGLEYVWRDIKLVEPPSCFSFRVEEVPKHSKETSNSTSKKKEKKGRRSNVQLAVGGIKGCIYMFSDVIRKLDNIETPSQIVHGSEDGQLSSRQFHWHREAVEAIEWSRDGNYLISGGNETVLVLWQLDTGRKQFLPHLESPIRQIVVSPKGNSYGIALADNSVMVLSTTELVPTANVAGLQSPSTRAIEYEQPIVPTVKLWDNLRKQASSSFAKAVINPKRPQELMLAVSSYQPSPHTAASSLPTPYLQIYNLATSRHISRDELAQTNATTTNLGPDGDSILEPNVKFVRISSDGQWLATVDEWTPPANDVEILAGDESDAENALARQREVRLKFWSRNEDKSDWTLHATIMKPHEQDDGLSSGTVFDLQADPYRPRFTTIGNDSVIKVWQPRKGGTGKQGTVQSVFRIPLEQAMLEDPLQAIAPIDACLAYSNDGSILAVYQDFEDAEDAGHDSVHLIDVDDGKIRFSPSGLCSEDDSIVAMGFLERYLICVGRKAAVVWDVVAFSTRRTISLQGEVSPSFQSPLLAVNLATSTFAIAVPEARFDAISATSPLDAHRSNVLVFSPDSSKPVSETELPRLAMLLISAGGLQSEDSLQDEDIAGERRGYLIIDAGATVRTLKPSRFSSRSYELNQVQANGNTATPPLALTQNERDLMVNAEESDDEPGELSLKPAFSADVAASEAPNVNREQLGRLFDYPSHAMPPLRELFRGVVHLFSRKPSNFENSVKAEQAGLASSDDEDDDVQMADARSFSLQKANKNTFESIIDSESESDGSSHSDSD